MFVNKKKNKKAISILISYVLLVTLALALATATYFFILPYAQKPLPEEKCPDGISLIIEDYSCDANSNLMDMTVKNTGRHNISGFFIKIVNISDGFEYLLKNEKPNLLNPADLLPVGGGSYSVFNINYGNADLEKIIIVPYKQTEEGYATICSEAIARIDVPEDACITSPVSD